MHGVVGGKIRKIEIEYMERDIRADEQGAKNVYGQPRSEVYSWFEVRAHTLRPP